ILVKERLRSHSRHPGAVAELKCCRRAPCSRVQIARDPWIKVSLRRGCQSFHFRLPVRPYGSREEWDPACRRQRAGDRPPTLVSQDASHRPSAKDLRRHPLSKMLLAGPERPGGQVTRGEVWIQIRRGHAFFGASVETVLSDAQA